MNPVRACLLCALLLAAADVLADYRDELEALRERVAQLAAADATGSDAERFAQLVDISYDYTMLSFPEFATYRGDPRGQDRWTDQSEAAVKQRRVDQRQLLAALERIEPGALTEGERLNFDLLHRQVREMVEGQRFPNEFLPLNQMSGPQQGLAQVLAIMRPRDAGGYEDMIGRLEAAGEVIDNAVLWMRKGLEAGVTPPRITLRDVPQQIRNQLVDDADASPMLVAFRDLPERIDPLLREQLQARARAAYRERIVPAYERLLRFTEEEYLPAARDSIALEALPDGQAWYAYNVRRMTSTELTPTQIHDIGLTEVKRIRAAMDEVIATAGFEGSFAEFLEFLRTDPQFYHSSEEALLREYRDIAKRADPELMKLFGRLPRTPYGVIEVPSYAAQSQTTAYYMGGSVRAGRPGYFYANTYALETRPRWEMEALTLHEAVPGHHLQLALQDELEDLPWFRQSGGYTAFTEGWGLYAESLGEEMGFYRDPYARFGQLTYEMWRAIRLVVDTGMHHLGWTRQQAIEYFKANAGKQEHDIVVEVDRYIVWPGQALAYKIGELKIKELRAWATAELGERFDIRGFHDTVLGSGAVPLALLEANVRAWVEARRQ